MDGWLAPGAGQACIVGRHNSKLLIYASQTSLGQGALAHAGHTAAPLLAWPEWPAVERLTTAEPAGARW